MAASVACSPERNIDDAGNQARVTRDAPADSSSGSSERPRATDNTSGERGKVTVLFFGTSLTAGYGLDPAVAFPNLIAAKAAANGTPIVAINAGLSGETSAGALRRIEWTMRQAVDVVVVETGGNDALRALDPDSLRTNLERIVARIRAAQPGAKVLLAVMEAPPNLGTRYTGRFRNAYQDVASKENLTLVPFLLDSVAGRAELNQSDGVHPNERGERVVAENVWRSLRPVVEEVYRSRQTR